MFGHRDENFRWPFFLGKVFMAAESVVSIANMALDHLKEKPISSLVIGENSTEVEELCARHMNHTRKAALRKHPWKFATKYVALPVLADAPPHTFSKQALLPTDYIRLGHIGSDPNRPNPPYDIVGNRIYFDETNSIFTPSGALAFSYIWDFDDCAKMEPLFLEIWALEWAIAMCPQINGTDSKLQTLYQMLKDKAPEAYSINGQDRPPRKITRSRALAARRGFGMSSAGPIMKFWD